MTSHSNVGNHRPPPRTASSGISRPPPQPSSRASNAPPRSVPQQTLNELNAASFSQNASEPASKRQKLDVGYIYSKGSTQSPQTYAFPPSPPQQTLQPTASSNAQSIQAASKFHPPPTVAVQVPCFPIRPKDLARWKAGALPTPNKTTPKEPVQAKPYQLEVPKAAPQYGNRSPTDFFPWAGSHPEDILSEQSTKSGYFDRSQVSQNESNTARPSLWSGLKHKSGLHILSSLFVSVLDQRQTHGTITAKCTFKPPPRVTLTDTKREAWLRDLANSTIPLRRLSRTIPHGIRGKSLLDHCLAKRIPTWRAVWLAKCVGANEIRAFKRKGTSGAFSTGGEAKWIRDWTMNVEQFLESLIGSCDSPDWRSNLIYGLQLTVHIYSEQLLDAENFLEWMTTSFDTSTQDLLPMWLLVIEAHVGGIQCFRYRSRKLAEALLEQLQSIMDPATTEIFMPIQQNIVGLIKQLVLSDPTSCLLPQRWLKYENILQLYLDVQGPDLTSCFQNLRRRNIRLLRLPRADIVESYQTPRQRAIVLLDSLRSDFNINAVSDAIRQIVSDPGALVSTLIEWSTTLHRIGISRIYTTLRILRRWSKAGMDLNTPLFCFIGRFSDAQRLYKPRVFKFIAELVRSRLLSVGKFLQWLIARGPSSDNGEASTAESFALQLLENIPLHGLQPHVLNLRQILMSAGGYSASRSQEVDEAITSSISANIGFLRTPMHPTGSCYLIPNLSSLSVTVKYETSRWLRQRVADEFDENVDEDESAEEEKLQTSVISVEDFQAVRDVLEALEDYPILADVLSIVSESSHRPLLEVVAETVNSHIDIFQAIGAAESLFQKLFSRLEVVYTRRPVDKTFLLLLIDLAECLPKKSPTLQMLRHELKICEPKKAVAACSPVSDHMIDAIQPSADTFIEDMELLFSSGTSMDRQVVAQAFSAVTKRLEMVLLEAALPIQSFMDVFAQLRPFDAEYFDDLLVQWMVELMYLAAPPRLLAIVVPLVCARLLSLQKLLRSVIARPRESENHDRHTKLQVEILDILTSEVPEETNGNALQRTYRFSRERSKLLREHPTLAVSIIKYSLEAYGNGTAIDKHSLHLRFLSTGFQRLLRAVLLHSRPAVTELGESFAATSCRVLISQILDHLLGSAPLNDSSITKAENELSDLLHLVDDFNVEVCELKLCFLAFQRQTLSPNLETSIDSNITVLLDAATTSHHSSQGIWARLVSILPQGWAELFRNNSLSRVIAAMPDWSSESPTTHFALTEHQLTCDGLLASIDVAESTIPSDGSTNIITEIAKMLSSIRSSAQLTKLKTELATNGSPDDSEDTNPTDQLNGICKWISILLRLLTIHQSTILHPKFPQQTLSRLLLSLSLLLLNPNLALYTDLTNHIFDLAAFFSDALTPESRVALLTVLRETHNLRDPRLTYLFGVLEAEQGEALLMTTTSNTTTAGTATSAMATSRSSAAAAGLAAPAEAGSTRVPFPLRRWEMVRDATPVVGENDTSLGLGLFGTRKAVL